MIAGFHAVIGGMSGQPHWYLNEPEAKRYGEAMSRAARHFPVQVTQKTLDVFTLIVTAGSIELPRIGMTIDILKAKNSAPLGTPRGPAQVFQFYPPKPAPGPNPVPGGPNAPPARPAGEGASAANDPPAADAPHDRSSDIDAIGGEPAA